MLSENLAKIIRTIYYILFFCLPFVMYPKTSELFEFNKMIVVYFAAIGIGILWAFRMILEGRILLTRSKFDIPIVLFFCSQLISTLFSIDRHTSFYGYYGRFNGGLLSLVAYLILLYAFIEHARPMFDTVVSRIFSLSVLSSVVVALWGLPGKLNHDLSCLIFTGKFDNTCWTDQFRPAERMFSTLGQPNWLGAYISIVFFIGMYLLLRTKTTTKWLYFVYIVGMFVVILFTRSRSSLLSLVPGSILFFISVSIFSLRNKSFNMMRTFFLVIASCFVFLVLFKTGIPSIDNAIPFFPKEKITKQEVVDQQSITQSQATNKETPRNQFNVTESFDIRKIVWEGAIELGRQYPLFGTGVETFGYAYYFVRPSSHNLTSEWDYLYNKAHNEYLNFFATTGWFGIITVVILICFILFSLSRYVILERKKEDHVLMGITFIGVCLSICITNFFGFSTTVINIYWYVFLIGIGGYLVNERADGVKQEYRSQKKASPFFSIGVTLVGIYLLFSTTAYWFADKSYADGDGALRDASPAALQAAVGLFSRALSLHYEHVYEDKQSYAMAQLAFVAAYQKQPEATRKLMQESEELNLKSIQSSPMNVLYWKTRIKNQYIYYQMSLDKQYLLTGLSALQEAKKLAPTDPKISYFETTYYSLLYDEEKDKTKKETYRQKALSSIERAISLKKNYGDAYYLKVQLYKKFGMKREAKELLLWYIPLFSPNNPSLEKEANEL